MKTSGVVVLYNPVQEHITNIGSYIDVVDQLYIVDNSKEIAPFLNTLIERSDVTYIHEKDNVGIAKALNLAAFDSIENGCTWLLTMDQDSMFHDDVLLTMMSYIEQHDVSKTGIVSPWHDTKLLDEQPQSDIDHPLDVMTSGNLVNLKILEELGGFKEWLFIDGVDIEYCLHLKQKGYVIDRLNTVVLQHDLGNITIKHFLNKEYMCTNHSAFRYYYMQRNYRYIRDMYSSIAPEFCSTLVKIKGLIFKIVMFESHKTSKIYNIYLGIRAYRRGNKGKYHKQK